MRKVSYYDNRPMSPIRQPPRNVSPFARSPQRQKPHSDLSPYRTRRFERTPKKYGGQPKLLSRSPARTRQYNYTQFQGQAHNKREKINMQQTIKNGIGLFQNLQTNPGKNQNLRPSYQNSNSKNSDSTQKQSKHYMAKPFDCSDKKKSNKQNLNTKTNKVSFTALLQNVKQIESIQGYYPCDIHEEQKGILQPHSNRYNAPQAKKSIQKSEKGWDEKGSQKNQFKGNQREEGFQKKSSNLMPMYSIAKQEETIKSIDEDYEDVSLLINKVSENCQNKQFSSIEELVIMSVSNSESLNMKPYL